VRGAGHIHRWHRAAQASAPDKHIPIMPFDKPLSSFATQRLSTPAQKTPGHSWQPSTDSLVPVGSETSDDACARPPEGPREDESVTEQPDVHELERDADSARASASSASSRPSSVASNDTFGGYVDRRKTPAVPARVLVLDAIYHRGSEDSGCLSTLDRAMILPLSTGPTQICLKTITMAVMRPVQTRLFVL
jgi:hypothetical protein